MHSSQWNPSFTNCQDVHSISFTLYGSQNSPCSSAHTLKAVSDSTCSEAWSMCRSMCSQRMCQRSLPLSTVTDGKAIFKGTEAQKCTECDSVTHCFSKAI